MDQASSTTLRCRDCNAELIKNPRGGKPTYCRSCAKERLKQANRESQRRRKTGEKRQPMVVSCMECQREFLYHYAGVGPERCEECRVEHQRQYLKNWQREKGHLASGTILTVQCRSCPATFEWTVVVGRRPWLCQTCQRVGRTQRRRSRIRAWRAAHPLDLSRQCIDCGNAFYRHKLSGRSRRCRTCQDDFSAQVKASWSAIRLAELRESSRLAYEQNGRWSPCQGCGARLYCHRMGLVRKWCGKCLPQRRREVAKAWREANPEAARNIAFKANQARRARLAAVESEPYKRSDILKRDKWTCKLCHKRIYKKYTGLHHRAASVDHQIPLDHGGADRPQNVVAAHVGCNAAKRTRFLPQGEQLMLFG